ncbi:Hypothetical protein FKW44_022365, partial [Caligus rogercresseyi]
AVLGAYRVVADLKALIMLHTDITWHANVAVSLPSGYAAWASSVTNTSDLI